MERLPLQPRQQWQQAVENLGFGFHTTDVPYWDESACYRFSLGEIEAIEKATGELWALCLQAVQHVIDQRLYDRFAIPRWVVPYLERSWNEDHPALYGRFDLCVKDGQIKLLEFNADTPTSLFEAAIVQWFWLRDYNASLDQFNSLHEKLIAYWRHLHPHLRPGPLHFACLKETLEDLTTTEYLRDCALQAGLETKLVFIDDLGWDAARNCFVELEEEPIANLFKLYPWEWLLEEEFGQRIGRDSLDAYWIEPAWKMVLSNKAILPLLWELFPNHPLLLPAYFDPGRLTDFVKKPLLGREGANLQLVKGGRLLQFTEGMYGKEGAVFQQLFPLPDFGGVYPVVGSWVVGQEPAGIGIRESDSLITGNQSRFVPHLIEG